MEKGPSTQLTAPRSREETVVDVLKAQRNQAMDTIVRMSGDMAELQRLVFVQAQEIELLKRERAT